MFTRQSLSVPASGNTHNADAIRLRDKKRQAAATIIQKYIRRQLAIKRVKKLTRRLWERAFDPKRKAYYWYNKRTGESRWKTPKYCELFRKRDLSAILLLGRAVRGFLGRKRVRQRMIEKYTKYFDPSAMKFYYLDKSSGETFWKASPWLESYNLPLTREDQALYDSLQKIKELEMKLQQKDQEIKDIRKQRYEELEPKVIADRVSNASRALVRSRDMDRWTTDQLCAWFVQIKMDEYIPFLFKNRVDGNLFVNLEDADWADMGITNRFHIRKLQLLMKGYRYRFQKKKDNIEKSDNNDDDDDDLNSEYSPSEVSDIIANEGVQNERKDDSHSNASSDDLSDDDLDDRANMALKLSAEEKQRRALDSRNIRIELQVRGDGENFPVAGDVVRVRYVCMLASDGKVVQTTKNGMQRSSVEFVIGVNQIIKGIDRALLQMSVGERSKIYVSPEYGYGKEGLYPHIPPRADLIFDLTLLGLRSRVHYEKPLIQTLGQVQKPYEIPQSMVSIGGEGVNSVAGQGRLHGKMIDSENDPDVDVGS